MTTAVVRTHVSVIECRERLLRASECLAIDDGKQRFISFTALHTCFLEGPEGDVLVLVPAVCRCNIPLDPSDRSHKTSERERDAVPF